MPTTYRGVTRPDGSRGIECYDPDAAAKTGRWTYNTSAEPKQYPDRCEDCYDPDTLARYPATHYRREVSFAQSSEFRPQKFGPVKIVTYYGVCPRCLRRYPAAKPLPATAGQPAETEEKMTDKTCPRIEILCRPRARRDPFNVILHWSDREDAPSAGWCYLGDGEYDRAKQIATEASAALNVPIVEEA